MWKWGSCEKTSSSIAEEDIESLELKGVLVVRARSRFRHSGFGVQNSRVTLLTFLPSDQLKMDFNFPKQWSGRYSGPGAANTMTLEFIKRWLPSDGSDASTYLTYHTTAQGIVIFRNSLWPPWATSFNHFMSGLTHNSCITIEEFWVMAFVLLLSTPIGYKNFAEENLSSS